MLLVEEEKDINVETLLLKGEENGHSWYRGQTNSAWTINPSFFVNAKENKIIMWSDILPSCSNKRILKTPPSIRPLISFV